jgi:hypothetical protein
LFFGGDGLATSPNGPALKRAVDGAFFSER